MRTFGCKPPLPPPAVFFKRFEMTHISCVRAPRVPNALAAVELELLLSFEVAAVSFAKERSTQVQPTQLLLFHTVSGNIPRMAPRRTSWPHLPIFICGFKPRTDYPGPTTFFPVIFFRCFLLFNGSKMFLGNLRSQRYSCNIFSSRRYVSSRLLVLFDRPLHMGENCLYCTI